MDKRIQQLREKSLQAVPSISGERARLVTEYYSKKTVSGLPVPVQRAEAFRYILENKRVIILKEELNTQPKFYYFYGT